ncbi:MAG: prepilin-type N-terminal cleavage/methylation domain-containing protein [Mariprofundus sp.]|nr:prepilin-type N-terminal cleavage/methylation domain-containing protein [Mariprofundus sp.]
MNASARGFTLIEVLMALTVFGLIAGLSYAALGTAGNGFKILADVRVTQEKSGWVARQLRSDLRYLSSPPHSSGFKQGQSPGAGKVVPIRIRNDNRGDIEFDQLWLIVREPGLQALSQVHYFIDENSGHLIRESKLLLARDLVEPIRWDFGKTASWSVEVLDQQGNWRQDWNFRGKAFVWPKAVRVTMKTSNDAGLTGERRTGEMQTGAREWWMPVLVGSEL